VTTDGETEIQGEKMLDGSGEGGCVKDQKNSYVPFCYKYPQEWDNVEKYYGLENFPKEQLFVNEVGDAKIVSFVNKAISDFLGFDTKKETNLVNLG
jgi:hypothetical protein